MKLKIVGLAVLLSIYYSCGTKSVATAPPPPAQTGAVVAEKIEMSDAAAAGKMAYENNCAKCHRLFAPKEYSKEDWAPILVRMQKKSHLDDAEMAPINNYIYSQL